jgi:hypothetical protein
MVKRPLFHRGGAAQAADNLLLTIVTPKRIARL